jgi:hypothetical protein
MKLPDYIHKLTSKFAYDLWQERGFPMGSPEIDWEAERTLEDFADRASRTIGGVVANNASGICCGTAQNSYKTISLTFLLPSGTRIDTAANATPFFLSFYESKHR